MSCLFSNCISLNSLPDISKWNVNNVENINGLFSNCKKLTPNQNDKSTKTANILAIQ